MRASALVTLMNGSAIEESLKARLDRDFLASTYKVQLYGGWLRDDGRRVTHPHMVALKFHEACKLLFCPVCAVCHQPPERGTCSPCQPCWRLIGSSPRDEGARFECKTHGKIPFRRCLSYATVAMLTGNQCLGGETRIWANGDWIRMDALCARFAAVTVLAWNGERLVTARATVNRRKGPDPLMRVALSNGMSFTATRWHRVLSASGVWLRVGALRAGMQLLGFGADPLPSISDSDQSARGAGDPSSSRIVADSLVDCLVSGRSGDARPPWVAGDGPASPPSRDDAPGRSRRDERAPLIVPGDDPESTRARSRRGQGFDRLPSRGGVVRCGGRDVAGECLRGGKNTEPFPPRTRPGPRPTSSCGVHLRSSAERHPGLAARRASPSLVSVVSVEDDRTDFHYDVSVGRYHNFLSECGVVQHNSGKTRSMIAEFSAMILGRRPWDDTLTAPMGSGRTWALVCQTLSASAGITIIPEFERAMSAHIERVRRNSTGTIAAFELKHPSNDIVHILSHQQYENAGTGRSSPFEGLRIHGVGWDEPMEAGPRSAVLRGLVGARSRGGGYGRELMAATPLNSTYLLTQIQDRARNMGGKDPWIHVVTGTLHDNPSLTDLAKQQIIAGWLPEEREAREKGYFVHLAGRVYPAFEESVHVYDPALMDDPLGTKDHPSSWPVACIVDPHQRKPWAICWIAVDPNDNWWVVREWPETAHHETSRDYHDFDDYARIIKGTEEAMPGGPPRVRWREMDPNLGRTPTAGSGYDTIERAMSSRGLAFRTDVCDDIKQGHRAVADKLAHGKDEPPGLRVSRDCENVIYSLLHYAWDDRTSRRMDSVKPLGKDFCDLLRYFAMRRAHYVNWQALDGWYERQTARAVGGWRRGQMR